MKQFVGIIIIMVYEFSAYGMEQGLIALRFDNYASKRVYCRINNQPALKNIFGCSKKLPFQGIGGMQPKSYYSQFLIVRPHERITLYAHRKSSIPLLVIDAVEVPSIIKINRHLTACMVQNLGSLSSDEYNFFLFCAEYYIAKEKKEVTAESY